jgi:AraC-like DNA-binding protein
VLFLGLRVPRKALALLATNLDGALLRLVPSRSAPLRLLTRYLRCVGADVADEPQILGRTVAAHVYDLIALIVGANADSAAAADDRGVKAARLRAIKTYIARHLADGELTIADVAAREGVTPRYVHKLFEGEGASFSRYVLDRRLEAAYRALTDQRQDHRSILSIAFDSGFADLSHFNRTFRRRYNATPTDVRFGRKV